MKKISLVLLLALMPVFAIAQNAARLLELGDSVREAEKWDEAIALYAQAESTLKSEGKENSAEYALCLHNLARTYVAKEDFKKAMAYSEQAMALRKQLLGEVSEDYINSLNTYAIAVCNERDFKKAEDLQRDVMKLCDQLPSQHPRYGVYAENMGRYLYINGKKKEAAEIWEKALPCVEKFGENYEFMLKYLGYIYEDSGDKKNMKRILDLMEEHNQHELTKECNDPECMVERADYYAATGDNAMAKENYLKALQMPMTDKQKVKVYESYAMFNGGAREFALAADYYLMAANAKKAVEGETEDYIQLVYKTAMYSYLGKLFEQSLGYYRQVIAFYEKHDSNAARKNIAQCHKGMGNSLSALQRYAEARDEHKLVVAYYEKYDKESEEYPNAITRVATAEKFNKEYDISIEHYKQAIAIYTERGMSEKAHDTQNSLNLCYAYAGRQMETNDEVENAAREAQKAKLDASIKEEIENLDIYKTYLGKMQYASALGTIAGNYYLKQDYQQSVSYFKQYMEAVRDAIRDEFRMQSEAERMTTWADERSNIQEIMEMLTTLPVGNEALMPDLAALAYDCQLLSKGILLNSSIEFEKIVNASNDAKLKATYEETKRINERITELRQTANTDEELDNIVKLQQQSQQLQLELNRSCAEIADFTDYIGYSWRDVQSKLQKDDVAIEFAAIKVGVFDNSNYMAAIVLTKDMTQPVAVPICNFAQVKAMQKDSLIYLTPVVGNLVWGNLAQYIKDKKRIYFSADGAFNQIGIEYLQWEGKPLSEQKDMVRLSSTKELCYNVAKAKVDHAAIFGDINYTEEGNYSADAKRSVATMRGSAQTADDGDIQFGNLDGTRKEMDEISKTLKSSGVKNVQAFADTKASEEAFLALSDSKLNLLHIATHGAYLAKDKVTDAESMQQSILAFAGANLGNEGTQTDGYVTAADVSKMNLRNCNLAVLSACETALGKMGDDGVFGLQRGFKNAGVHTLLMSLRQVDDKATTELMTQFYHHLMAGSTPNESLRKAQQHLRKHGYDDPQYWASFIILDGNK